MQIVQEILVLICFAYAAGYMFTKFVWKPKFIFGKKNKGKSCGDGCGSCH